MREQAFALDEAEQGVRDGVAYYEPLLRQRVTDRYSDEVSSVA